MIKVLPFSLKIWPLGNLNKFTTIRPDFDTIRTNFLDIGCELLVEKEYMEENSLLFLYTKGTESCKFRVTVWETNEPILDKVTYIIDFQRLYGSCFLFYELMSLQSIITFKPVEN